MKIKYYKDQGALGISEIKTENMLLKSMEQCCLIIHQLGAIADKKEMMNDNLRLPNLWNFSFSLAFILFCVQVEHVIREEKTNAACELAFPYSREQA